MIVQLATDKQSAFVIRQQDHAAVSGVFAEHFGNDEFAALNPRDAMIHVAAHHDDGWESIDGNPELDTNTGYVYHLTKTAMNLLLVSSNKSPEANESYDLYSGIISSMHTYGLFHGRYGLSDKIFIDMVSDEWRDKVKAMLDVELKRQERIKAELAGSDLIQQETLFHNYKLLQFFDTLALYIQTVCPQEVGDSQFLHVPRAIGDDVTVTAKHNGEQVITLSPWVFDVDSFEVSTKGRIMTPIPAEDADKLPEIFENTPIESQTYTFQKA